MDNKAAGKISIEEAIRLKHQLNKDITYGRGGLNAKQFKEMEGLTREQYTEVGKSLSFIKKTWWFFPDFFWIIGILIGLLGFSYLNQRVLQLFCVAVIIYYAAQLAYRASVNYGFVRGYEDGHTMGVRKAFGITPADAGDVHERAVEMEMDGMLIKRMDERKKDHE